MSRSAASVLGHAPEAVMFSDSWTIMCACGWETWGVEHEEEAWETFNDHIFDDVKTAIARMREVVVLRAV